MKSFKEHGGHLKVFTLKPVVSYRKAYVKETGGCGQICILKGPLWPHYGEHITGTPIRRLL